MFSFRKHRHWSYQTVQLMKYIELDDIVSFIIWDRPSLIREKSSLTLRNLNHAIWPGSFRLFHLIPLTYDCTALPMPYLPPLQYLGRRRSAIHLYQLWRPWSRVREPLVLELLTTVSAGTGSIGILQYRNWPMATHERSSTALHLQDSLDTKIKMAAACTRRATTTNVSFHASKNVVIRAFIVSGCNSDCSSSEALKLARGR